MDALYSWGIGVIEAMQALGSVPLNSLFKGITFLGNEEFYLLFIPLIFWCLDRRLGSRLVYLLMIASFVNYGLKSLFAEPRPFLIAPGINLIEADGYGFPSGHAQLAVVIWGVLAFELGRKWSRIAAIALMFMIGVSRVFLGVHFPTDVLAGWAVGAAFLILAVKLAPFMKRNAVKPAFPLSLVSISGLIVAVLVFNQSEELVAYLAAFWGFSHGQLILSRFFPDSTTRSILQRIARYPIGTAGMFILYFGLKTLFPAEGESLFLVFRFIRYAMLGLWAGLAAPLLFRLLRMHSPQSGETTRKEA
jgi:undecaprenyl-diphosphatase